MPLGQRLGEVEGGGDRASDSVGIVNQERNLHGVEDNAVSRKVVPGYEFVTEAAIPSRSGGGPCDGIVVT
ncbi:hypothetical protein GCM10023335_44180 [Streptomyces siamensis]|uniref:Uncharacterized protein n=1 Tax=Streptomyces siamensis TaxID=1274986 RepID=A0ABP9J2Y8_9ACTN